MFNQYDTQNDKDAYDPFSAWLNKYFCLERWAQIGCVKGGRNQSLPTTGASSAESTRGRGQPKTGVQPVVS